MDKIEWKEGKEEEGIKWNKQISRVERIVAGKGNGRAQKKK